MEKLIVESYEEFLNEGLIIGRIVKEIKKIPEWKYYKKIPGNILISTLKPKIKMYVKDAIKSGWDKDDEHIKAWEEYKDFMGFVHSNGKNVILYRNSLNQMHSLQKKQIMLIIGDIENGLLIDDIDKEYGSKLALMYAKDINLNFDDYSWLPKKRY